MGNLCGLRRSKCYWVIFHVTSCLISHFLSVVQCPKRSTNINSKQMVSTYDCFNSSAPVALFTVSVHCFRILSQFTRNTNLFLCVASYEKWEGMSCQFYLSLCSEMRRRRVFVVILCT